MYIGKRLRARSSPSRCSSARRACLSPQLWLSIAKETPTNVVDMTTVFNSMDRTASTRTSVAAKADRLLVAMVLLTRDRALLAAEPLRQAPHHPRIEGREAEPRGRRSSSACWTSSQRRRVDDRGDVRRGLRLLLLRGARSRAMAALFDGDAGRRDPASPSPGRPVARPARPRPLEMAACVNLDDTTC